MIEICECDNGKRYLRFPRDEHCAICDKKFKPQNHSQQEVNSKKTLTCVKPAGTNSPDSDKPLKKDTPEENEVYTDSSESIRTETSGGFCLGEKIKGSWEEYDELHDIDFAEWIMVKDVKEFIRLLKEEFTSTKKHSKETRKIAKIFTDEIDKLAGDELI